MDFDFTNSWSEPDSFRAQSVVGSFTLNDVKLQKLQRLPANRRPGLANRIIVGRSGSGKSSIAKRLFGDSYILGFNTRISASWMISQRT